MGASVIFFCLHILYLYQIIMPDNSKLCNKFGQAPVLFSALHLSYSFTFDNVRHAFWARDLRYVLHVPKT